MKIRKYYPQDKPALINLWQTVFPNDPPYNNPDQVIQEKLKTDDLIFIAEADDKLIGACMAGYDGHRGWLYAVAVLPEYRRSKAGTRLVEEAIATLKEIVCAKVNLQIRSTNHEVADFYKSLGFTTEDRLSMGKLLI